MRKEGQALIEKEEIYSIVKKAVKEALEEWNDTVMTEEIWQAKYEAEKKLRENKTTSWENYLRKFSLFYGIIN